MVRSLMDKAGTEDVLDYGCGKRTLEAALGLPIKGYDPAIEGHEAPPEAADIVVCTDVLEHVEPECLDAVLDDLKRVTKLACLLCISTTAAAKSLPDGRNAHLIIADAGWWFPKLWDRWRITQMQDVGNAFWCIGGARHG